MLDKCPWLQDLQTHYDNNNWLAGHVTQLYTEIRESLYTAPLLNCGIEGLILMLPYALTRRDADRWTELLYDALTEAQKIRHSDFQMQIWTQMGESRLLAGDVKAARVAFRTALARAEEQEKLDATLEAYIGLVKTQMLTQDESFTPELVDNVMQLARRVENPTLVGALHQALALAYTHRGDKTNALAHGQVAYAYWFKLGNTLQKAKTAFVLAQTYRIGKRIEQAQRLLGSAKSLFAEGEYPRQYAIVAHEQGVLHYERGQFQAAKDWFELALKECSQLNLDHYTSICRQSLALTQIELRDYEQAELGLLSALESSRQAEDVYREATILYTLGYLHRNTADFGSAAKWLQKARTLCQRIPRMQLRSELEHLINDIDREISDK